jgi:hypothetical protein
MKNKIGGWERCCTPVILALRKQRQEDCKFKASHSETLFQKHHHHHQKKSHQTEQVSWPWGPQLFRGLWVIVVRRVHDTQGFRFHIYSSPVRLLLINLIIRMILI